MYAIEMQGITKTFHGSYANKEVSLKVEQGEIHSLLGENGAGKTTLFNCLTDEVPPDGGTAQRHFTGPWQSPPKGGGAHPPVSLWSES